MSDSGAPRMQATNWRPLQRGSLAGFVTLNLASGFSIRDCTVHRSGDRRWVGLPGKPQIDTDGNTRRGVDGKIKYTAVLELSPAARDRFQEQALAAVDELLAKLVATA